MTLRRGRNGWARKPRRSLGTDFGAWSAATYCVRWLQDTVPRLCAKLEVLKCKFNEVSSRLSMTRQMGNHVSEKRFCIFKLIKLRMRGDSITVNWDDPIISMCQCDSTIEFTACKTKGHIKTFQRYIFWFIKPKKASGCCLSLQLRLIIWYRVLLDGPAWCIEEILAIKPIICWNSPSCDFWRWRSNNQCYFNEAAP